MPVLQQQLRFLPFLPAHSLVHQTGKNFPTTRGNATMLTPVTRTPSLIVSPRCKSRSV